MTEVQDDCTSTIRFQEIEKIRCTDYRIILEIVGKYPGYEVDDSLRNQWVCIATYQVALDKLVWIGNSVDLEFLQCPEFNIPILEFSDGFYMLEQHSENVKLGTRADLSLPIKPSLTFNSLLKLNKLIQYIAQAKEEMSNLRGRIDKSFQLIGHEDIYFKRSMDLVNKRIENLRKIIDHTRYELDNSSVETELKNESDAISLSDDYGQNCSKFEHDKGNMLSLQRLRLLQFLGIIKKLNLSRFITISEKALRISPFLVEFHYVELEKIISTSERELTNSQLGYYLLVLNVLAEHILFIPLPFKLSFRGSNSTVDDNLPFYLPSKLNQQAVEDLNKAFMNFNVNVTQIKQYMEFHR